MPSSSSSSARDAERKALGDFNARSSFNKELNQLKVSRGEMDDLRRKLKKAYAAPEDDSAARRGQARSSRF